VRRAWGTSLAIAVTTASGGACRTSTSTTLDLTTDATCSDPAARTGIAFAARSPTRRGPPPRRAALRTGEIGTILLVPSIGTNPIVAIEVVASTTGAACPIRQGAAAAPGCIVARRRVAFLPRTELPGVRVRPCVGLHPERERRCSIATCGALPCR
jgi:hypothetical protein